MSLGVLNNLDATYAQNNLNNTSNSLSKVLQQLSSGSKINSGADDAAGLSLVNGLQANYQALNQSETNASEGVGLLTVADGALSQVTSLLNRAVTLATEASNGTLNSSQLSAANQEYQSILSEISNIGSTTTYNQQQVFGSTVNIYTGDSTDSGASINALNISTLSSSNIGDTDGVMSYTNGSNNVFVDLSKDGDNAALTDSLNASGSTSLTVNYVTSGANGSAVNATATITVGTGTSYDNTVSGMIAAINGAGLGLSASLGTAEQAGTGATGDALAANTTNTALTSAQDTGIIITGTGIGTGGNDAGEIGKFSVTNATDALTGTLNVVGSDGKTHQITLGTANSTDNISDLANTINSDGYGVTAAVSGTSIEFTSTSSATSISATSLKDAGTTIYMTNQPSTTAGETLLGDVTVGTTTTADSLTIGSAVYDMTAGESAASIAAAVNKNTTTTGISASVDSVTGDLQVFSSNATPGTSGGTNQFVVGSTNLTVNTGTADQLATVTLGTAAVGTITIGSKTYATTAASTLASLQTAINANTSTTGISLVREGAAGPYYLVNALGSSNVTLAAGTSGFTLTSTEAADNWGTTSAFYTTKVSQNAAGISDAATGGGTANTALNSDVNGTSGVATISYSHGAGTDLNTTNLTTQTGAQDALTALNQAVANVAAQDGYIGAQINTLNSVSNVLSTQSENVQSAQNDIQATNYAQTTSDMSKYEILTQTGISALAQANSQAQEVTKLLQ